MEQLTNVFIEINSFLWGPVMLVFLLGTGVWLTFQLRFVQVRYLGQGFKQTFAPLFKKEKTEGIHSFKALATSISAQVGTGNLAGVATAIAAGGPGAIFWMWVSSFFGMATIFAEAVLAQLYKVKKGDQVHGGPAYYIRDGLGSKWLAGFFAVAIILALGFVGNMVQSNAITTAMNETVGSSSIGMNFGLGVAIAFFIGLILFGGIQRISTFAGNVVPIMALLYIIGSLAIMVNYWDQLVPTVQLIVKAAISPEAAGGGVLGATIKEAIRYGIARGLFSNEAGMGSTPHAHAVADVKRPSHQGLVAMVGVFIDTVIICTLTAMVILITDSHQTGLKGSAITQEGFARGLGEFGTPFIAICLLFFAFTTILGWAYFGEVNVRFLFGQQGVPIYRGMVLLFIVAGSLVQVDFVWEMADTFNALMVLPNLIALLALTKIIKSTWKQDKLY
ncbi:alanine/glycine:cation symporter family protein [Halobacillus karajensis]|uniref:Amino-acid carrier protein AlsT n=1 Tax=Halobacillus karajensis TaxID=195088 RepID=A0A059NVQ3_9BACI|nr:sodium:alanine symporter family protein [Halobacillus karajensis]CDQ18444.1 Amino-acid carrier protein AlsT [Halobacillus karajensis]CDQ23484.1 Amino-acid carrier protein AlsT [Halobacillus karajensis]CDQ26966.1 Amino-acid carrier protein AlsT [Halobacillus karajensis]